MAASAQFLDCSYSPNSGGRWHTLRWDVAEIFENVLLCNMLTRVLFSLSLSCGAEMLSQPSLLCVPSKKLFLHCLWFQEGAAEQTKLALSYGSLYIKLKGPRSPTHYRASVYRRRGGLSAHCSLPFYSIKTSAAAVRKNLKTEKL